MHNVARSVKKIQNINKTHILPQPRINSTEANTFSSQHSIIIRTFVSSPRPTISANLYFVLVFHFYYDV